MSDYKLTRNLSGIKQIDPSTGKEAPNVSVDLPVGIIVNSDVRPVLDVNPDTSVLQALAEGGTVPVQYTGQYFLVPADALMPVDASGASVTSAAGANQPASGTGVLITLGVLALGALLWWRGR